MSNLRMSREQWTEVFQATGLDEAMMLRWHREFEQRYPAQHQFFLEWINLSTEDILKVRKASQVD